MQNTTTNINEKDVRREEAENEQVFVPRVDIREEGEQIELTAEMPGVAPDGVSVTVERNVLTIEGRVQADPPAGCRLVGQEFCGGRFRRDFTLSGDVDADRISAVVRHGVLKLAIPKREEVRKRKIEITK